MLMTEVSNAVMTHNDGHMSHFTTASSQPFVVSSVSTKRYAPAIKTPVQRLSPIPPPTSTAARLSVTPTKQAARSASLPTVVPKAESRRPSPKPSPIPPPQMMTRVQKSPPSLLLAPSTNRSFREKTFVAKPLKIVQKLKGGKLMDGCTASVTRRSTQVTANELPPRPSCVPRSRVWESVLEVSKARQDVWVKVSTTGSRNPKIPRRKPFVHIGNVKTAGRAKAMDASVDMHSASGGWRTGIPTRKRRLTASKSVAYPQVIIPLPDIAWSPPPSPYLSSFPSQTWTIVVDETLSSTSKSSVATMSDDSCGPSEVISPLILSPSLTVFEILSSSGRSTAGSDGMTMLSSPTKGPSAEVSHTVCAATIISPSRNGSASSVATLAKVIDSQASSSTGESGKKTQTTVQCAFEIARTIFSPLRRASQSSPVIASTRTTGTNVSRIRKLFIPQPDKDVNTSKNPMTQIETEILRAEKKVTGGEMDPRLDYLGSLAALGIFRKLVTSGSDIPSQF